MSIVHGTLNGYHHYVCRCEACKDAVREYRRALQASETPDHVHGTAGGYNNHARRCDPCKKAWSEQVRRTRNADPERIKRHRARARAQYFIQRGDLQPQPCEVCGSLEVQAHHEDYDKPLNLRWLCREHHLEEGDGIGGSPHVYKVGESRSYSLMWRNGKAYHPTMVTRKTKVLVKMKDGTIVPVNRKLVTSVMDVLE